MIEVEIRSKIDSINKIKERLKEINAKFLKSEKQIDRVFGHPMFLDSQNMIIEGGFSSRIRQIDDKISLEFKEIIRKGGGIEIKSELKDINAGLIFLKKLGWEEAFIVSKTRELYEHDDFEVCLDNVERLGNFIEIEKTINSPNEKEGAREECINLLNIISPNSIIENRKYGDLMQEIINKENNRR
jgi:adenylate cyclase class 2